ncbi:MAG: hypothetical protein M3162_05700 [Thermoproteota archaeon]|nr:hypothetical protein [Thermoproteota archaeon]
MTRLEQYNTVLKPWQGKDGDGDGGVIILPEEWDGKLVGINIGSVSFGRHTAKKIADEDSIYKGYVIVRIESKDYGKPVNASLVDKESLAI